MRTRGIRTPFTSPSTERSSGSLPSIRRSAWSRDCRTRARARGSPRRDLLLLFTDGVSDARNRFGVRLGEQSVLDHRAALPFGDAGRDHAARLRRARGTHRRGRAARRSRGGDRSQLSGARMRPPPIRKSLGQHFLSDPRILARIADAVALGLARRSWRSARDGAGSPMRCSHAARAWSRSRSTAKLVELLREKYAHEPNLTIIEARCAAGEPGRARRRSVRARRQRAVLHHDTDSLSGARAAAR